MRRAKAHLDKMQAARLESPLRGESRKAGRPAPVLQVEPNSNPFRSPKTLLQAPHPLTSVPSATIRRLKKQPDATGISILGERQP
jgi:hypothetical protein